MLWSLGWLAPNAVRMNEVSPWSISRTHNTYRGKPPEIWIRRLNTCRRRCRKAKIFQKKSEIVFVSDRTQTHPFLRIFTSWDKIRASRIFTVIIYTALCFARLFAAPWLHLNWTTLIGRWVSHELIQRTALILHNVEDYVHLGTTFSTSLISYGLIKGTRYQSSSAKKEQID